MMDRKRRRPSFLPISAAALLALATSAGCKKEGPPPPPPPPTVEVAPVTQKDVTIYQEWIGTLDGNVNAEVRPQIEGYVLLQVYKEGFAVKTGDLLFEIDPRQFQATLDQTKGQLAQFEATLANAKTTVARYRPLAAQKAISQQELDDAETKERTSQANVESAQATLEKAKLDLAWTKVNSPIDGIAGLAKSQVGDLVNRLTVMTTISQVNPIRVYFNPSEQEYLAWVAKYGPPEKSITADAKLGDDKGPLELILADGSVFPHRGRPILVGREVDVKTGTIQIAGVFPNPGNLLRPGQYGKVRVAVDTKKGAILVPQRAVNELQGSYQVAVVGADNTATIKVVTLGPRDGNLWVVEKGLSAGDRVVVEGIQRVRSGMKVAPKEPAATAGEGVPADAQPVAAKETGK
jgi:membrane fusion protein (multidrug efflux system)